MSLYVILGTVFVTILSSILTLTTHFIYTQHFTTIALITAGSVLFGVVYFGLSYLWVLYGISYLK